MSKAKILAALYNHARVLGMGLARSKMKILARSKMKNLQPQVWNQVNNQVRAQVLSQVPQ